MKKLKKLLYFYLIYAIIIIDLSASIYNKRKKYMYVRLIFALITDEIEAHNNKDMCVRYNCKICRMVEFL